MKQGWSLQGNYDTIAVAKITKKYLTLIHTKKHRTAILCFLLCKDILLKFNCCSRSFLSTEVFRFIFFIVLEVVFLVNAFSSHHISPMKKAETKLGIVDKNKYIAGGNHHTHRFSLLGVPYTPSVGITALIASRFSMYHIYIAGGNHHTHRFSLFDILLCSNTNIQKIRCQI